MSKNSNSSSGQLGWVSVWALTAGGMVGGGIYTALGVVVALSGQWAWLSFLISGILAFITSYSYIILSNKFQESGGAFRFLREINRDKVAGSISWLLIIGYILTIAVYAFAFGHYLSHAFHAGPMITRIAAILIVGVLVFLNLMGVTKTKIVEIIIVVVNLIALIILAVIGIINWNSVQLTAGIEPRALWSAPIGAASIFIAYEGFQLLSYEYDKIKNPKKILKPTILSAVAFVVVIYIVVALGATVIAGALTIIDEKQIALSIAATEAFGTAGLIGMTLAAVFATSAAINSTLFSTANLTKRIADDGELPKFFEHTNSNDIPDRSVILLGAMAAFLAVIGSLSTLVEAASLVFLFTFGSVNVIALEHVKKKFKWVLYTGLSIAVIIGILLLIRLAIMALVPLSILVLLALIIIFGRPAILKKTKTDGDS